MILLRPAGDNLRFPEATIGVFAVGWSGFRNFAHLALWDCAIFLRADADIVLFGRAPSAANPLL